MSKVMVKNRQGDAYKPRANWLKYWKDEMGTKATPKCACCNINDAEVWGHVYKAATQANKNYYIAPLCKSYNSSNNTDAFAVNEDWLVSAT